MNHVTRPLQDEQPFSEDEREKLQSALQLDPSNLDLVLDTTTFILQQVTGTPQGHQSLQTPIIF